ncbi:MAG TPA: CotH kinase family protein, partial [Phycisphaerae bacterium]|nr:CotH kinase family protein [Phycisphaerae bacterium]
GAENIPGVLGMVGDTQFSFDRGFYTDPIDVAITSDTEDVEIFYTTDGSEPHWIDPDTYTGPISKYDAPVHIDGTTMLRAMATKAGYLPTNIDTQTYLFLSDVVIQSPTGTPPPGWPSSGVNGQVLVYGMDPDIVNNPQWDVVGALQAIPTLSMVTDLDNLFYPSTQAGVGGIYVNANMDGRAWERPTSLELIYPEGASGAGFPDGADDGFQINCGVRIRGGYSRQDNNPKHAFRFFFRDEYGDATLQYPLFGEEGVDVFDSVDLRTSQNYSWAFGGPNNNTMVREVSARDLQGATGEPYTRTRYYHLYINGVYWGLFETQERSEASYAAANFGGEPEDYDVIHQSDPADGRKVFATDGTRDAYDRLYNATLSGYSSNWNYYHVQGMNTDGTRNPAYERLLDVDNLIDYMLVTFYVADNDGPGSHYTRPRPNNYWAVYNRENPDGFKFFAHDMEHSYGLGTAAGGDINNLVTPLLTDASGAYNTFNAHWLHQELMDNAEYRMRFADSLYESFYNDGVMTYENVLATINYRATQIDSAIVAESARWGDTKTHPPKNRNHWLANVNAVRNWIAYRTDTVVSQVRSVGWYPNTNPPNFNQHGGQILPGFPLTMNASTGTIYYTTDGSDPRLIGGGTSSAASTLPSGGSIVLARNTTVKARVKNGGEWSALHEATFVLDEMPNLVVTEIMYNPADPTPAE